MKKINYLLIFGLLLFKTGLSQPPKENLITLRFDFENTGPIKMSEIISKISYIPLETKPDCMIGTMNIPVFGKDIIIRSYTGRINGALGTLRFSNQGKFLNKIGNIGRGPGEYQDNSDVALIDDTVFVISNFTNRIFAYSLSGSFIKDYHLNTNSRPKGIIKTADKSFLVALSNPSQYGIVLKTDRNFNIKTGYIKSIQLKDNPIPYGFQISKNTILFYYSYLDTIFDLTQGNPKPAVICDYGKFKKLKQKSPQSNPLFSKPYIANFSSNDQYMQLYVYYPFNENTYTTFYRMVDGKQVRWKNLVNDVDGGTLDRWSGFLDNDNNLIFHLMPTTIIERFKKMTESEKLDPKNSGFVNMASKITLESNPVIMICKLK